MWISVPEIRSQLVSDDRDSVRVIQALAVLPGYQHRDQSMFRTFEQQLFTHCRDVVTPKHPLLGCIYYSVFNHLM